MISLSLNMLEKITGGVLYNADDWSLEFKGVTIDSRCVTDGKMFVAIKGQVNDGHRYIEQAVTNKASVVVAEKSYADWASKPVGVPILAVDNSHEALLHLAQYYRNSLEAKFIGITGSNGKTTTKEFTYSLFRAVDDKVFRSPGNFNNLFGVPLSICAIPNDTNAAVMEMGISTPEEMPLLTKIVKPEIILITNIGPSHLQFLASVEQVARMKLQMVMHSPADTPFIINADNEILVREAKKIRPDYITFSIKQDADFKPERILQHDNGITEIHIDGVVFNMPFAGNYQVENLTAAYAIFKTAGYSMSRETASQISFSSAPMRGQMIVKNNIKFMVDCYNANPESVKAGLKAYFHIKSNTRRIIVLGDMLELGEGSEEYHRQVGRQLYELDFDKLILVGADVKYVAEELENIKEKIIYFENAKRCSEQIKNIVQVNDFVYLKGSRSVGLEVILEQFNLEEKN